MGAHHRQIWGERLLWPSRANVDRHKRGSVSRRAKTVGGIALAVAVLSLVPPPIARERLGKFNASAVMRIPPSAYKTARAASRQPSYVAPETAQSALPLTTIGLLVVGILGLLSAWLTFEVARTSRATAKIQLEAAHAIREAARIGERTALIEAARTTKGIAVPATNASVLPSNDGDARSPTPIDQTDQLHQATSVKKPAKHLARPPG